MTARIAGLIVLYLAAIVAANQTIAAYGPSAVLYVGAGLIAFNLVARDILHDAFHEHRLAKMALLIATGAALSYTLNADAAKVALASAAAFAASEAVDAITYQAMRRRPWLARCNASNVLSAAVDTLVFFSLAFGGVPVALAFAQVCAKVAGGVVYSLLVEHREPRDALLARHA
jgi:uncharacterized PurR-regulated membrane protein YhhQ (DUF165 family)